MTHNGVADYCVNATLPCRLPGSPSSNSTTALALPLSPSLPTSRADTLPVDVTFSYWFAIFDTALGLTSATLVGYTGIILPGGIAHWRDLQPETWLHSWYG